MVVQQRAFPVLALNLGLALCATASATSPPAEGSADDTTGQDSHQEPEAPGGSDPVGNAYLDAYWSANARRFDLLSNSASPRQQVLAGRIYFNDDEDSTGPLRPRREDVVDRAAALAPDDAFVQWAAAEQGRYTSSQCGPTKFPEQAVANLVRLEPDNAAAWQFAVALASAMGDEAGVDDALSRMASAKRADDHQVERVEEWTTAYLGEPQPPNPWSGEMARPASEAAFASALQQASGRSNAASSVLETVCSMRAESDRVWQRLGWCADAATTLATRGGSLAVRKQGLDLLSAMGVHSDEVTSMQRQYEWLMENQPDPLSIPDSPTNDVALFLADWQGAGTEIEAIERRMQRLGLSMEPAATWSAPVEPGEQEIEAMTSGIGDYLGSLIQAMRTSDDPRQQIIAMVSGSAVDLFNTDANVTAAGSTSGAEDIARLAAVHGGDVLVQWIAATAPGDLPSAEAITRLQQLEPDNAAAWLAQLAQDPGSVESVLPRLAASRRYVAHGVEILRAWKDAAARVPPPEQLESALSSTGFSDLDSSTMLAMGAAGSLAMKSESAGVSALRLACNSASTASNADRRRDCVSAARLLLHSGTTMAAVMTAQQVLGSLGAMDPADISRNRQITWWARTFSSGEIQPAEIASLAESYLETGSEIEAMRLLAQRKGHEDAPETWRAPGESWTATPAADASDESGSARSSSE